jgi:hypothetical protein
MKQMKMTTSEYLNHTNNCDGYCPDCNDVTRNGDTEPDAEEYECYECGEETCMGIEQAMLYNHLLIVEGKE